MFNLKPLSPQYYNNTNPYRPRKYQILTQEVTETQAQLTANQREMARLKAQQTEAERDVRIRAFPYILPSFEAILEKTKWCLTSFQKFWFQREYNSILYRLAPPPVGAWALGRPYVPGAPVPHVNGAS